ncbi:MAG: hypothetical protein EA353_02245 [Puniceicoccaceae bacterium]|nr:MAG: hypothetical protein EA353_02245 [Puniceicoccaceae bacterium]
MTFYRLSLFLFGIFSVWHVSAASRAGDRLLLPETSISASLRQTPMPELGDGRLARILSRYYQEALGGPDNWNSISSFKMSGTIRFKEDDFSLNALQRKPNLIKMTLRHDRRDLVLAYDGTNAWKHAPRSEKAATLMGEDEARRFILSAQFGNYLLFPYAEGKDIVYIDTVPIEGKICHQIRVTLDSGFQLDYYIDIRTFLEIKVENKDLHNNTTNSILYSDYTREHDVAIARRIESFENGQPVSTILLEDIKINAGVIPWMFTMPR